MKFLNALAFAGAASAAALSKRIQDSYYINNLAADCDPSSSACTWYFTIGERIDDPGNRCTAVRGSIHEGNTDYLPPVNPPGQTCTDDDKWYFEAVRDNENNFILTATYRVDNTYSASFCAFLKVADFEVRDDGDGTKSDHYIGPPSYVAGHDSCNPPTK